MARLARPGGKIWIADGAAGSHPELAHGELAPGPFDDGFRCEILSNCARGERVGSSAFALGADCGPVRTHVRGPN